MGKTDFTWDLDLDSIMGGEKFDESAYDYANALNESLDESYEVLSERIETRIHDTLDIRGPENSENIKDFIIVDVGNDGFEIRLESPRGEKDNRYLFVEFGTGIVGERGPKHRFLSPPHNYAWGYDTMNYGDSGWWYPTTAMDPNPTKRRDAKTGEGYYAWTKGQPAVRFMYEGWLYGSRSAVTTINNRLRNKLRLMEAIAK